MSIFSHILILLLLFMVLLGSVGILLYTFISVFTLNHIYIGIEHLLGIICTTIVLSPIINPLLPLYVDNQFEWVIFIFFYGNIIVYLLVYRILNIPISIPSFLAFLGNIVILALYLIGFYNLTRGLPNPIYIENLSTFSYYRYMFLLAVALIGIIVYFLFKVKVTPSSWQSKTSFLTFPYFKEEVRKFLYTWNETIFGPICSFIMDNIYSSRVFRYFFVLCHFSLIYLIRLIQSLFFFNFIVFHGDLRYSIYLLPLSFLSWMLSFFEYYLKTFFEGTCNYIREILSVSLKEPLSDEKKNNKILYKTGNDFIFTISESGLSKGFTDIDIYSLGIEWLRCGGLTVLYERYSYWLSYYTYFILFLRLLSWSSATHNFISAGLGDFGKTLTKIFTKAQSQSQTIRPYATEAFKIKKQHEKDVESATKGAYKAGHPIFSDKDKEVDGKLPFIAQGTHGKGPLGNPSKRVHDSQDLAGKALPQNAVFPKEKTHLPKEWVDPNPIPKSKEYFEKTEVKESMFKHSKDSTKDHSSPSKDT